MARGTFANIRIRNKLCKGVEGPYSVIEKGGKPDYVYEIAR